jgi:hypothetical protein
MSEGASTAGFAARDFVIDWEQQHAVCVMEQPTAESIDEAGK